jgi:hypothetical protein
MSALPGHRIRYVLGFVGDEIVRVGTFKQNDEKKN